jgi:nucleoside-diphosphate-sugar epimerase
VRTVILTGVSGRLGQRVLARLQSDPSVEEIIGLDHRPPVSGSPKLRFHLADLAVDDLKPILEDGDVLVHADWPVGTPRRARTAETDAVERTRRLLDAAAAASVEQIIHVSSATVYGAWPDNPVPLTEDATLRPNPGAGFAAAHAEVERLLAEWRADHPSARVVVLRPTIVVGPGPADWVTFALVPGARPVQYVHVDDVAEAVATALAAGGDGVFNVAPDGWTNEEVAADLVGGRRLPLPDALARRASSLVWHLGLTAAVPAYAPYRSHPWVVANDRLKALGWRATSTSEEALVASSVGSVWGRLSAKRRQGVVLGGSGAVVTAAVGAIVSMVRRRRRRRAGI